MPRKDVPKTRGVFEYPKASGVWWIHYHDADGQRHREKVGRPGDAIDLYKQRKADARAGKKLPRNLQRGGVTFQELADAILIYSANHHEDTRNVKSPLKAHLRRFRGPRGCFDKARGNRSVARVAHKDGRHVQPVPGSVLHESSAPGPAEK